MNTTPPRADTAAPPAQLIFVVEDDVAIARLVVAALHEFGFATEAFRNGASVLRCLQTERPELCIIDLGLPDMDGIELVRRIAAVSSSGVLILTGRGHTFDRVMGLELGADDYMVKPFEPRELVARVRSILRRRAAGAFGAGGGGGGGLGPGAQRRHAAFLDWRLDCAANILCGADGAQQVLGTAETQVLRAFLERPYQIHTREQLVGQRDLAPQDRSIDVRISRLRRKLEADPLNPTLIKTVYGAGYMFSAAVSWS